MKLSEKVDLEKAEKLIAELDAHPATTKYREDKAAEILAKRRETTGRIEALRNEQAATIPKLEAERDATEGKYVEAKAALVGLADDCRTATLALRTEGLRFNADIVKCENLLFETADPLIDEAITFFRDKLDELRKPGRIDRRGGSTEKNIFTWRKKTTEESNVQAILDAMAYGLAAIPELERMKLSPELDRARIEGMKAGIPRIDVYTESTVEKPMEKVNTDPRSLLPSDSEMQWSIGKLNEKFKKVMGRPA